MVKKVELKEGEDFNNLKELIKLIGLGIKVIERNGILNIFRHVGHDRDMSLAPEEYAYLYAFTNESNHIYSENEKLFLFKKYLENQKYHSNYEWTYVYVKGVYCLIDEIEIWISFEKYRHGLIIAYTVGGAWFAQIKNENEICIGSTSPTFLRLSTFQRL